MVIQILIGILKIHVFIAGLLILRDMVVEVQK